MRPAPAIADLAAVLVFVGIGRSVHADGLSFPGLVSTAWPFVAGLALGWVVLIAWKRDGACLLSGLVTLVSTVSVGMALRVVAGQGTAVAFVFVALAFLGMAMLGWRVVGAAVLRSRT